MKPVKLSVRRIIEFVLRAGDIDNRFRDSSAMYKGVAAHRKIQKESGENYKKEVTLTLETEIENIPIILKGRADGIITDENGVIIDEIKTTALPLEHFYKQENLHYGQGMVYAHMYLQTCETRYSAAKVQLTYFQLESEEIQRHEKIFTRDELSEFFNNLLKQYGFWLKLERDWKITRNLSISETNFPFETYRKGQRELAVAVYRTISAGKKLYVSAPTGIGKTLSAIFPSIKSLEKGMADKIFYLTAKTVTRTVAEDAVKMLTNLRIKTITLRAKEKICTNEIFSCNPENCASAKGHFDRVNSALADLITNNDLITPAAVAEYAQKHNVCPHEFSLDAALHCDIIIGDYNHVFDPVVYLKRFFENVGGEYIFLIDEAHNLVDRVRDMHSAALRKSAFSGVKVRDKNPLAKNLRKAIRQIKFPREKITGKERDSDFAAQIFGFSEAASEWLLKSNQHEMHNNVLELFFESGKFLMISEIYDNHKTQFISINDKTMTLFCLDPSEIIAEALKRAKASVLFSATLTPLPYFRETLGGNDGDTMLMLPSPFDPRRFATILHTGISTKYTDRENSYAPISEAIFTAINSKKGNYLVFFPSYIYMQSVYEIFTDLYPHIETLLQTSSMTEDSRAEFLTRFDENNPQTLVGFTVLGGIFSEGIDLAGDRLIGTIIIGVGFPKISSRHDLIRDYFNEKNGDGFDYAYVFPGMNKVLQAAGRVIRTETDSGFVLLIDSRYAEQKYKNLLPAHWTNKIFIRNAKHIPALI